MQRKSAGRVEDNRLLMWQDIRFDYDPWGNLRTKRSGSGRVQHFSFDADNRLLAVLSESPRGFIRTRFEYDALGRRSAKTDEHVERSGSRYSQATRFVWQGLRMVQEQRESGLSNYIYSPDEAYTPLARVDAVFEPQPVSVRAEPVEAPGATGAPTRSTQLHPTQRVLHFHTDLVGLPLEVTDKDGELAWAGEHTAWGRLKGDITAPLGGQGIEQPLRFAGQYADASTGLHYNTFRYYDPDVGRYISQDPIGLAGGENLYGYVPSPAGWVDPLGLSFGPVDFTGSPNLFPTQAGQSNIVEITMQGTRSRDYVQAFQQSGISKSQASGYTWHHANDFNPETGRTTMQLVKTEAHIRTFPHAGSADQFAKHFGVSYDSSEAVKAAQSKGWLRGRPPAGGCQ